MESQFKIGDRVRFVEDCNDDLVYADEGDCGTVIETEGHSGIVVELDAHERISVFEDDCIEILEYPNPKTAFLSELKGLLEKYGYSISSGINFGESDTYKAFGGMGFISSDESQDIDYNPRYGCITHDNIMDYEK